MAGVATADTWVGMSLFAVQLAENDEMVLVVDAAVVVSRDAWWVFRNADDQPVATLPQAAVCTIDVLGADDVRGRPWGSLADQLSPPPV